MKLYEYQRWRSFIDLGLRSLRFYIFKLLFLRNLLDRLKPNFMWSFSVMGERKSVQMVHVTWPRWPPFTIYGKNMKNSSSLEPKDLWPWKFVCSIGYSSTTKFIQMMTLGWPWSILWLSQIWSPILFAWEKLKTIDFSETIVVYDIKVSRCSQLNESFVSTKGQSHSLTLV